MADINSPSDPDADPVKGRVGASLEASDMPGSGDPPHWEMIELLFFAYRDFIGDPDVILNEYGFGRAHHRVLHFVNRSPGLSVAELLEILKITKQSLGRVLRELVEAGFVEQMTGDVDRRQRLLHATEKGRALALSLAEPQSRRIREALKALDPEARDAARAFLRQMINENERESNARFAARR
jgi:DNA-binding MarR family transcriptional regulator